jgi:hypothetical protein
MQTSAQDKLQKVLFIRGSVEGLLEIARGERFDMMMYLLEMVNEEAKALELRLKEDIAKPD